MSESLKVYFEEQQVGILHPDEIMRLHFKYTPEWLDDAGSFPVSKSITTAAVRFVPSATPLL